MDNSINIMTELNKKQFNDYWAEMLSPLKTNRILIEGENLIDAKRAIAKKTDGNRVSGLLLITDLRIVFILDPEDKEDKDKTRDFISLKNEEIDEIAIKRDLLKKDKAQLILFYKELVFMFEDVMLFGVQKWAETIMKSKKNIDKQ